ncbi:hypothetical protein [Streptomyces sp. NRRL S-1824]|uniref:hypothetical protein n=1 Tax=Streptomyces sp. NRRL S-1824 TaxID=1463889 RepID=UPI000AD3C192|nr:hypothetical protein [Streptomyces sp. NRRL S-1824]
MTCSCQNKNRETHEVVTEAGKVVFSSSSKPTATAVSKRYPNSEVRTKSKAGAQAAPK